MSIVVSAERRVMSCEWQVVPRAMLMAMLHAQEEEEGGAEDGGQGDEGSRCSNS